MQLDSAATEDSQYAGKESQYDFVWASQFTTACLPHPSSQGDISEAAFMEALQRKMENTVLGQASGSYAQRVQAEYLKEVEARAKQVFRELQAAQGPAAS